MQGYLDRLGSRRTEHDIVLTAVDPPDERIQFGCQFPGIFLDAPLIGEGYFISTQKRSRQRFQFRVVVPEQVCAVPPGKIENSDFFALADRVNRIFLRPAVGVIQLELGEHSSDIGIEVACESIGDVFSSFGIFNSRWG
jgi:hypothetical protein